MRVPTFVSIAILATGLGVTACGRHPTVLQADQTGRYAAAVALYENNGCITCHGNNLQGGVGPSLQKVGANLTAAEIHHRIEAGAGPMPGYGPGYQAILTNAQIDTLTTWLAAQQ